MTTKKINKSTELCLIEIADLTEKIEELQKQLEGWLLFSLNSLQGLINNGLDI